MIEGNIFVVVVSKVEGVGGWGREEIKRKQNKRLHHRQRITVSVSVVPDHPGAVLCCFTATETIRLIRDGDLRMVTSGW